MQKDFHFYLTYALCRQLGIDNGDAEVISWANQYTDELTDPQVHGIQTQTPITPNGNWEDEQVQLTVLVPFHFVPGSDRAHPWVTVRNNGRIRRLVNLAAKDPVQLGIALHAFQDTFSHEGFSGWREDLNSCYPWYHLVSALPNVGHAEMQVVPDVSHYVWTDPRTSKVIRNERRALSAAKATHDFLVKLYQLGTDGGVWTDIRPELVSLFRLKSYDDRVTRLCVLSGNADVHFQEFNNRLEPLHASDFVRAARRHLSETMRLLKDLPTP